MKKVFAFSALAVLVLSGCSNSANQDSSPSASVAVGAQETYSDVKNWAGIDNQGAKFVLSQGVTAPSGVEEARGYMGKGKTPLNFVAVTVDNRQGSSSTSVTSAYFTDVEGKLVEYTLISDFLNYQDVAPAPSDGEESRIIEVHNAFTGDNYEIAAGEKKTVILASEHSYPSTLTHATINNSTVLSPTDEKASADEATGAPTPSEPVGSDDTLAKLTGTTLKGNDIRFYIFSPNYQKELNNVMPQSLNGSWGAICSVAASEDQLNETGAQTTSGTNTYVWRSITHALAENGISGLGGEADYKEYEAKSLPESGENDKCVVVNTSNTAAATKTATAQVGLYNGASIEAPVEVK